MPEINKPFVANCTACDRPSFWDLTNLQSIGEKERIIVNDQPGIRLGSCAQCGHTMMIDFIGRKLRRLTTIEAQAVLDQYGEGKTKQILEQWGCHAGMWG